MPSTSGLVTEVHTDGVLAFVMVSDQLKTRLVLREAVLQLLERRRAETGDPALGVAMEKRILDLELADLEMAMAIQKRKEDALIRNKRTERRNT
jgi:hypothetical protein